jgi:hypothetical protein
LITPQPLAPVVYATAFPLPSPEKFPVTMNVACSIPVSNAPIAAAWGGPPIAGTHGYPESPTRCHVVEVTGSCQKLTWADWSHVIASKPPGTATIALGKPPDAWDRAAVLAVRDGIDGVADDVDEGDALVGVGARVAG